jgi:glutathione S-transferase
LRHFSAYPMALSLVIGNKNYSSWSLRPWLLMKHAGLGFDEFIAPLHEEGQTTAILQHSPAGKVPVLIDGALRVWDSLAICEYIAERTGYGWPAPVTARALARSISAEMHSGFEYLRSQCPMNVRARKHVPQTPGLKRDLRRVDDIWRQCREAYGASGQWLFGNFSIADAMYAPVAFRASTYGLELSATSRTYVDAVLTDRHVSEWRRGAAQESECIPSTDAIGVDVSES